MTSGHHITQQGPDRSRAARRASRRCAGALGVLGSVACAASMIAAAVGVGGAAAATSMAGMTGTGPGAALGALIRAGPWLTLISGLLVTAAFALTRRPVAALPALLAGAVLYAGMYAQRSLPVMYASIAAGYLTWAALALWAARARPNVAARRKPPEAMPAAGGATQDVTTTASPGRHPCRGPEP